MELCQALYCSSLTCSIQSTTLPSSFSWMAMCVMAVVGAAPCQCFSPGENQTTSPGRISSIGPPHALRAAATGRDDESLTQRMRVPCRPRSRLEGYAGALNKRRIGRLKKRIDSHRAGEPVCRSFAGRLRACSFDFHFVISFADCFSKAFSVANASFFESSSR